MAVPQLKRLVTGFPLGWFEFEPHSCHVGFVVGKVTLEQVSFEYFVFPCKFLFH
jgi:hypothetical protein